MKKKKHVLSLGKISIKKVGRDVYKTEFLQKGMNPAVVSYGSLGFLRKCAALLSDYIHKEEQEGGEQ